jgi:hypothetical protein
MARRTVTNHWFVSVDALRQGRPHWTPARETKTFPTEAEAKQYAKEMLSEKTKIVAGTLLSGHQPVRRIISGSELYRWIEKKVSLRKRLHHPAHRGMFPVLDLDPVLRPSGLIRPVTPLRYQSLKPELARLAEQVGADFS